MTALIVSLLIFIVFSVMIIREYGNDNIRQEFGYRVWTLGFFAELTIMANMLSSIN